MGLFFARGPLRLSVFLYPFVVRFHFATSLASFKPRRSLRKSPRLREAKRSAAVRDGEAREHVSLHLGVDRIGRDTISLPFFPSLPRAWVSQDTIMLDHLSRSRARPALHATRFARGHLRRSRYVRNLEIMRLYIEFNTFCKSIR